MPNATPNRTQDLASFRNPKGFRGRNLFVVQIWRIVQASLFACSPQIFYGWRRFLLRLFGARVGKGVMIRPSARITYPWKLDIGDYAWVGDFAELYNLAPITIGRDAVVSQYSYICTGSHDFRSPSFDIYAKPIVIHEEAWVCSHVFVHPGLVIARGSVVSARSVVTTDTTPYDIYGGHPAQFVKPRGKDPTVPPEAD